MADARWIQATIVHTKLAPPNAVRWPTPASLAALVAMFTPGKIPVLDGHDYAKPIGKVLRLYLDSTGMGLVAVLGLTKAGAECATRNRWLSPRMWVEKPERGNPNPPCELKEVSIVKEPGLPFTAHSDVVRQPRNGQVVTASARDGAGTGTGTGTGVGDVEVEAKEGVIWTTCWTKSTWTFAQPSPAGKCGYRVVLVFGGRVQPWVPAPVFVARLCL